MKKIILFLSIMSVGLTPSAECSIGARAKLIAGNIGTRTQKHWVATSVGVGLGVATRYTLPLLKQQLDWKGCAAIEIGTNFLLPLIAPFLMTTLLKPLHLKFLSPKDQNNETILDQWLAGAIGFYTGQLLGKGITTFGKISALQRHI